MRFYTTSLLKGASFPEENAVNDIIASDSPKVERGSGQIVHSVKRYGERCVANCLFRYSIGFCINVKTPIPKKVYRQRGSESLCFGLC
jgi:hypothetical protein